MHPLSTKQDVTSISKSGVETITVNVPEKIRSLFLWPGLYPSSDEGHIKYWQNRVMYGILLVGVTLGLFAYVPSVWLSIKEGLYHIALLDTAAYLFILFLFFWKKASYLLRASGISAICYAIGLILVMVLGPFGGGPVWLFAFPLLAGVLLGFRISVAALVINAFTLIAIGVLIQTGSMYWYIPVLNPTWKWVVIFFNFILLNTITTVALTLVLRELRMALDHEKEMRRSLQNEIRARKAARKKRMKNRRSDPAGIVLDAEGSHESISSI
jgi:hypothetical protein